MQLWSESTRSYLIIQWIRISDFGLLDPDGDPDRRQHLITWSLAHALPLQEFCQNPFTTFSVIRRTDKQTEVKTSPPSVAEVIRELLSENVITTALMAPTSLTTIDVHSALLWDLLLSVFDSGCLFVHKNCFFFLSLDRIERFVGWWQTIRVYTKRWN